LIFSNQISPRPKIARATVGLVIAGCARQEERVPREKSKNLPAPAAARDDAPTSSAPWTAPGGIGRLACLSYPIDISDVGRRWTVWTALFLLSSKIQ
jgi:hypothetical protein